MSLVVLLMGAKKFTENGIRPLKVLAEEEGAKGESFLFFGVVEGGGVVIEATHTWKTMF